ncbi:hypothetical protein HYW17_04965 [Candidatus Uhrbacteria bacterium]|nr:hypothetical protein [Candidatus Uhrbacteria bacterium]
MEGLKNLIKGRVKIRNKHIHSEAHYWADVISSALHERKRFAMYLGIIKKIGIKNAQKIFAEVKQSAAKNPGKLFVWKAGKNNPPTKSPPLR